MSGARKFAFVQSQVLFWVLFGVVVYFLFTKRGAALGLLVVAPMALLLAWTLIVMRRRYKRQFPHGRRRKD